MMGDPAPNEAPSVAWMEEGRTRLARWLSERRPPPPERVILGDDRLDADTAYRHACEGTAILWRGDFQNARQLLAAMGRRSDRSGRGRTRSKGEPASPTEAFHRHRMEQARRAHVLGMLLVEVAADHSIPLNRAPDVRRALSEAFGPIGSPSVIPLRELLGVVGAHEWRRNGVHVPALGDRIHPHYGVFSPIRQEHIALVAEAPLPSKALAFDIGTGTGILAALLARRGVGRVVATDVEARAVRCARDNLERLGLADRVEVVEADLFPPDGYPRRAPLVVCNPPWIPAKPTSRLDRAVYDPKGRMLNRFLQGLPGRLSPSGEGWLLLSDLAEHLELRTREELLGAFEAAGLEVTGRTEAPPTHRRVADEDDPLHPYRRLETTSLWRLRPFS